MNWWEHLNVDDFKRCVYSVHGIEITSDIVAVTPGRDLDNKEFRALKVRSSHGNNSVENMSTIYVRPGMSYEHFQNSLESGRLWFADQFAQEQLGIAPPKPSYWRVVVSNPEDPSKRIQGFAVCDPVVPHTIITEDFCAPLGLTVTNGQCRTFLTVLGKRFIADVSVGDISILAIIGRDLIERAIMEDTNPESLLKSLFLDSAVRAYAARRKAKAKTVLVLGSYGGEGIKRLRFIEAHLFKTGYDPVLVADHPSAPESLEAKVLSFITISRFVIYEATFPSGGIDEFAMCKNNEAITAVLHEKGRMATAMQAHYAFEHSFIEFFPYEQESFAAVLQEATKWAETVVANRTKFYLPK
jgi:hypothetical protein